MADYSFTKFYVPLTREYVLERVRDIRDQLDILLEIDPDRERCIFDFPIGEGYYINVDEVAWLMNFYSSESKDPIENIYHSDVRVQSIGCWYHDPNRNQGEEIGFYHPWKGFADDQ